MALFEFYGGKLVPAQFGVTVNEGLDIQIMESIRAQVLELIDRAIFPVAWSISENTDLANPGHSLTAIDYSGQVVSVEVIPELNPVTMVAALSRLGVVSQQGWQEIMVMYPGGPEAFKNSWQEFKEQMPANTPAGAKLYLVVGSINLAVLPALGVLFNSGVEIHRVSLRQMSNGRRFLEIEQLQPGRISALYTGSGKNGQHERLSARPRRKFLPKATSYFLHPVKENLEAEPMPKAGVEETPVAETVPVPELQAEPSSAARAQVSKHRQVTPVEEESVSESSSESELDFSRYSETLNCDSRGLAVLAEILGRDTVLLWKDPRGRMVEALLTRKGQINPGNGQLSNNVNTAFWQAAGGVQQVDAWEALHLNTLDGPTLAQAISEINERISSSRKWHRPPRRG